MPETILDRIVAAKRHEITSRQRATPLAELQEQTKSAPPPRDFFAALACAGPIRLIAEIKKASPSAGVIREHF
ncbi:MAG: indole-3-glycerol-phosphate synthase TrpC, partial [Planctomycetota bacterium]